MKPSISISINNSQLCLAGLAFALGLLTGCGGPSEFSDPSSNDAGNSNVYVNGVELTAETLQILEQRYGVRARPGRYWYDDMCGAVGYEGRGTAGFLPAGLGLGGPLRANASNGSSAVFVNGRELTTEELAALRRLTPVSPGRYWLDGLGNAGTEGGPAVCNLAQLARRSQS